MNSNNNSTTLENEIKFALAWKIVEVALILGSGQSGICRLEQGMENVVVIAKVLS